MTDAQAKRAIDRINGWLSCPRSTQGMSQEGQLVMQGYLMAINKIKEIINDTKP